MKKVLIVKEALNGLVNVIKALTKCKFKLRCCFESSCNTPDIEEKNDKNYEL